MDRHHSLEGSTGQTVPRSGFLCMGVFREIFVVGLAVGLVIVFLDKANTEVPIHLTPNRSDGARFPVRPVSIFGLDCDRKTLVVQHWPNGMYEVSLDSGRATPLTGRDDLFKYLPDSFFTAISQRNSTLATLSMTPIETGLYFGVSIERHGEQIISEDFVSQSGLAHSINVSANGAFVLFFGQNNLGIGWDLENATPCRSEFEIGCPVEFASLAPDGREVFVYLADGTSSLCDSRSGKQRITFENINSRCRCAAWSSDGRRLAISDQSGILQVFDSRSGQRIWHEQIEICFANSLAFSNEGNRLAVGGFDHKIRIRDLDDPTLPQTELNGQAGVIRSMAFVSGDLKLVSGSSDGTILEWSLINGKVIRKL